VELLFGYAPGFLDFARNDGVADLTLRVSMDVEAWNLELSCRLANSLSCKLCSLFFWRSFV
jgi:hypothetical protein